MSIERIASARRAIQTLLANDKCFHVLLRVMSDTPFNDIERSLVRDYTPEMIQIIVHSPELFDHAMMEPEVVRDGEAIVYPVYFDLPIVLGMHTPSTPYCKSCAVNTPDDDGYRVIFITREEMQARECDKCAKCGTELWRDTV